MSNDETNGIVDEVPELWRHPRAKEPELYTFQQYVTKKHRLNSSTYEDLWQWSVDHPADFWQEIWEYTGLKASKPPTSVGKTMYIVDKH